MGCRLLLVLVTCTALIAAQTADEAAPQTNTTATSDSTTTTSGTTAAETQVYYDGYYDGRYGGEYSHHHYSSSAAAALPACPPGQGRPSPTEQCQLCPYGRFNPGGVKGQCLRCPTGTVTIAPGATECGCRPGSGTLTTTEAPCKPCANGTYSPGGSMSPCIRCPGSAFMVTPPNATRVSQCTCKPGFGATPDFPLSCQMCPIGTYANALAEIIDIPGVPPQGGKGITRGLVGATIKRCIPCCPSGVGTCGLTTRNAGSTSYRDCVLANPATVPYCCGGVGSCKFRVPEPPSVMLPAAQTASQAAAALPRFETVFAGATLTFGMPNSAVTPDGTPAYSGATDEFGDERFLFTDKLPGERWVPPDSGWGGSSGAWGSGSSSGSSSWGSGTSSGGSSWSSGSSSGGSSWGGSRVDGADDSSGGGSWRSSSGSSSWGSGSRNDGDDDSSGGGSWRSSSGSDGSNWGGGSSASSRGWGSEAAIAGAVIDENSLVTLPAGMASSLGITAIDDSYDSYADGGSISSSIRSVQPAQWWADSTATPPEAQTVCAANPRVAVPNQAGLPGNTPWIVANFADFTTAGCPYNAGNFFAVLGTGSQIAPYLVLTAAHVLDYTSRRSTACQALVLANVVVCYNFVRTAGVFRCNGTSAVGASWNTWTGPTNATDYGIIFLNTSRPGPFYRYNYAENLPSPLTNASSTYQSMSYTWDGFAASGSTPGGCGCTQCPSMPCSLGRSGPTPGPLQLDARNTTNGAVNANLEACYGGDGACMTINGESCCIGVFSYQYVSNNASVPVCTSFCSNYWSTISVTKPLADLWSNVSWRLPRTS